MPFYQECLVNKPNVYTYQEWCIPRMVHTSGVLEEHFWEALNCTKALLRQRIFTQC